MGRKKTINKKALKAFDPEKEGIIYEENEGIPLPEHLNNEDGSLDNNTWLRGKNKQQKTKVNDKTTRRKSTNKTNRNK